MKTARELLLERHRTAAEKLKSIDPAALGALAAQDARRETPRFWRNLGRTLSPALFYRAMIWPWRRVWAGIAVTWVVIVALDVTSREPRDVVSVAQGQPDAEVRTVLREQRQILAELLGPTSFTPMDRPRSSGPRSEIRHPEPIC